MVNGVSDVDVENEMYVPFGISVYRGDVSNIFRMASGLNMKLMSVKDVLNTDCERVSFYDREFFEKNYFDTSSVVRFHPDGSIKIIPESVTSLGDFFETRDGALILSESDFNEDFGYEFIKEEVERFANIKMNFSQASQNPLMLAAVGYDKHLLEERLSRVYKNKSIWGNTVFSLPRKKSNLFTQRYISLPEADMCGSMYADSGCRYDVDTGFFIAKRLCTKSANALS